MKKFFVLFALGVCLSSPAFSSDDFLPKAQTALDKGEKQQAQFWIARYLAAHSFEANDTLHYILKVLRLEPKGFVPSSWPPVVRQWFIERGRRMWMVEASFIHEDERRFEVERTSTKKYFATLALTPEIQTWYNTTQDLSTSQELLTAGASKPAPLLAFGRLSAGGTQSQPSDVVRLSSLRALHHAVLRFQDMDGDDDLELVVRLTWLISNGFRQTVWIYKLTGNHLTLWKTLDAPVGFFLKLKPDATSELVPLEQVTIESALTELD